MLFWAGFLGLGGGGLGCLVPRLQTSRRRKFHPYEHEPGSRPAIDNHWWLLVWKARCGQPAMWDTTGDSNTLATFEGNGDITHICKSPGLLWARKADWNDRDGAAAKITLQETCNVPTLFNSRRAQIGLKAPKWEKFLALITPLVLPNCAIRHEARVILGDMPWTPSLPLASSVGR